MKHVKTQHDQTKTGSQTDSADTNPKRPTIGRLPADSSRKRGASVRKNPTNMVVWEATYGTGEMAKHLAKAGIELTNQQKECDLMKHVKTQHDQTKTGSQTDSADTNPKRPTIGRLPADSPKEREASAKNNPTRTVPIKRAAGKGPRSVRPNIGRTGWSHLDRLVAKAKSQLARIARKECYVTAEHWDIAETLEQIRKLCAKKGDWGRALRKMDLLRQRAWEYLQYRKVFKSRAEAAACPVLEANYRIRKALNEDNAAAPGVGSDDDYNDDRTNAGTDHKKTSPPEPRRELNRIIKKQTLSFQCAKTMEWLRTPPTIWAELTQEFNFTVDVCASSENHLLPRFYTEVEDGLAQDWSGEVVYCHPLFDGKIGRWVKKAFMSRCVTVMLLPAATHTRYFHRYIHGNPKCEVRFLEKPKGGFRFGKDDGSPDDPKRIGYIKGLMVVIFRNDDTALNQEAFLGPGTKPESDERVKELKAATSKLRKLHKAKAPANDEYYTPAYALDILLPYLPRNMVVWEAAWGTGELAGHLAKAGHKVVGGPGLDILKDCPTGWDAMVTNPPYSIKTEVLQRAYDLGKPFALLLPLETLVGKRRRAMLHEHGIQLVIPDKRIKFHNPVLLGNQSAANFPTAWFCWGLNLPKDINFVRATW